MAMDKKKSELWVGWTRDAINQYDPPENAKKLKTLIDDMTAFTTAYADAMLEEFERRLEGADDDDDDDDDDEDER